MPLLAKSFGFVMLALFAFFFIVGAYQFTGHVALLRHHDMADGSVVRLRYVLWTPSAPEGHMGSNRPDIYAIVAFTDTAGVPHQFQSSQASYPSIYKVGDAVKVIYPTGNPAAPLIYSLFELWFEPVMFMGLGGMPLLLLIGRMPRRNKGGGAL